MAEVMGSTPVPSLPATPSTEPWSRLDTLLTLAWCLAVFVVRLPFVARIEGVLDHDQSVVGLMALDIAAGRRFPIFFDGQRYMGAVEAYVAAAFVRALGHSPSVIALAPLSAFAIFAAGQFAVWRCWQGRRTGHFAAALTVIGSPMLAIWGIIPRGGYVEFLAWALPTFAVYRRMSRPDAPRPGPLGQAAWGFLLGLGYFLNPLSLTVYATIALDWTFCRHGADLRRERAPRAAWLDWPTAPVLWLLGVVLWISVVSFCCHVDAQIIGAPPYVALGGLVGGRWGTALGALGVVALIGGAAWWSGGLSRLHDRLARAPWTLAGGLLAWSPFLLHMATIRLGWAASVPTLPIWISSPWKAWPNLQNAVQALGPLLGCDPRAIETVLIGQGTEPPLTTWPLAETRLIGLSPLVVALVLGLILFTAWQNRGYWTRAFALRGTDVSPPVPLMLSFLVVIASLYLLQATSPNVSSIRYLIPVWVALPGLLASGLRSLSRNAGRFAMLLLVVPWLSAQVLIWQELVRPTPTRPLALELRSRGIRSIVAPTPIALMVANLTQGAVGGIEYQPIWPRLGDRYVPRLPAAGRLTCVVDLQFPWPIRGAGAWSTRQDFRRHLLGLSARHPGRINLGWELGSFEVWDVDLPLAEILSPEP
ncbi:MAG: hypothetical protein NVSMB9_14080 [Isosphaeraceae bacterium]